MKSLLFMILAGFVVSQEVEKTVNQEYLNGYNHFTADIYRELKKTHPENFVVSPLSVDIILSLVEYGSKGETSRQLVKALNLPKDKAALKDAIVTLMATLNVNETYALNSANKVYVKKGYELNENFRQFATDVYKSEVENVDFDNNVAAAELVNKWVEDKTYQKIKDLINEKDINKDTRAILVNALYFHGEWATAFNKLGTKKDVFLLSNNEKTEVDFMQITHGYRFHNNQHLNAKFLELPYIGNDVTLTIALPNSKDGLEELESKLSEVLDASHYKYEQVKVKIPKFKIETTIQFKEILQSIGIVDAFEDIAEFPEITKQPLKITKVVQKAFIDVDEEGTTAAASTAVIMDVVFSAPELPQEPKEFIADHPFIFVLKYKTIVLFIGHYSGK